MRNERESSSNRTQWRHNIGSFDVISLWTNVWVLS